VDLQTLWFAAVALLWTGFLLLEGFDFGVAALLPVLGRREGVEGRADRHLMLRTIGPLWDGNEVWLITAVGAVFAAFPGWYATWLPALYLPFVLVLFGLIVRAVAFEWRHSHSTDAWDATWTRVITGGSLIAAAGIGAASGPPPSACRSTPRATGSAARSPGWAGRRCWARSPSSPSRSCTARCSCR
jgi:cytochrome d ubiquinol oxidase subunit II